MKTEKEICKFCEEKAVHNATWYEPYVDAKTKEVKHKEISVWFCSEDKCWKKVKSEEFV